jgi:hypothetical protein
MIVLGLFVLVSGIMGRKDRLEHPSGSSHLVWYCAEAAGTIYFANLPFLSSYVTSDSPVSIRRMNSRPSLRWPRSLKEKTSCRVQRLGSDAALNRTSSPSEAEDAWNHSNATVSTPMAPILSLRPSDPPPELEDWTSRRPSTRGTDAESWTRRPSTKGTDAAIWSRRPSVKSSEADEWPALPSIRNTENGSWSRRASVRDLDSAPESRRTSVGRLPVTSNEELMKRSSVTSWYHAD